MTSSYAIMNIILAFLTSIVAIIFLCMKENARLKVLQHKRVRIAKAVALQIAIVSCLICIFAENPDSHIIWCDRWTIVLVIIFLGELYADYYVYKRCHFEVQKVE